MKEDYRESQAGERRFNNPDVYQKTVEFQNYMQSIGVAWHNPYSDECCSDFACCTGKGNYHTFFPSYSSAFKEFESIRDSESLQSQVDRLEQLILQLG